MSGLILVTGATGKTGRALTSRLTEAGVAHRAASRAGEPAFDWMRPETWDPALKDVTAIYLVAPPTVEDPYSRMIAFLERAKAAGVGRFVFLGMAGLAPGTFAHGLVHQWLIDNATDWSVAAPSAFMENFAEGSPLATIRDENTIYSNTADGRVPFISADDIARAAAALLTAPAALNRAFLITGEEALSYDDVAAAISRASGRQISHTRISTEDLAARFIQRGLPEMTARFLAAGYETIAAGAQAQTSPDYRALTGRAAVSFEAFAQANAETWRRP